MKYSLQIIVITALIAPAFAYAVEAPKNFKEFIGILNGLIGLLVPLIFTLTFLTILWGVIKSWIIGGGESNSIEEGKKIVTVGIIALVVMSSIWGILKILQATFFGL